MGKIIRVHKNKMIKATMVGEPATPGYIQLTANMVKRTANLSDLTDVAEARKNLGVVSLDDLSVAATPNSIVRRDANSRFKIIDAEATNEPVSLNQLNNKQYSLSSNNITGVAPISKGGTGKTTAAEAFAALGGRALGKLDNIALTDSKITGVLPLAKGGTGANNAASARATLGLGSCIGIALYDPVTKIGGLAHIMLPDSTKMRNNSNIAKFADTGIEELLKRVIKEGASKTRLVAKIAGGAKMFEVSGLSDIGNVGLRNAEASKAKLKELGIRLVAEDTGLNYGRTVELHCDTGEYYIKSVGKPIKII